MEIFAACTRRDWEQAEKLFETDISSAKIYQDRQGWTILHEAINQNAPSSFIKKLLRSGLDPNQINHSGKSPLHYAVQNTISVELLQLLIDAGGNVNLPDKNGKTVLHWAVVEDVSIPRLQMLLQAGGDLNRLDNDLRNVVQIGLENISIDLMLFLLDHGADVNCKDLFKTHYSAKQGNTPLFVALQRNASPILIQTLLKYGGAIEVQRFRVAKYHGSPSLSALIERAQIFCVLRSPLSVRRLSKSLLRAVPVELIKLLDEFLYNKEEILIEE